MDFFFDPPAPPPIVARALDEQVLAQADAPAPTRDSQQAVAFCDRFNEGENLPREELAHKRLLMASGGLKFARCMPVLFMSDVLGPYAELAKLSPRPAPTTWIDGDAHYGNFGVIVGNDGRAVWGLNDYDMACKGSPAMDLDRLAFSLVSGMHSRGLPGHGIAAVLADAWLDELKKIAVQGPAPGYLAKDESTGAIRALIEKAAAVRRGDWILQYAQAVHPAGLPASAGTWRLRLNDTVQAVDSTTAAKIRASLQAYQSTVGVGAWVSRPLVIFDVARKTSSGGSSHGQPRFYALVQNANPVEAPILLELKQELPAPLVDWDGDATHAVEASSRNWSGDLTRADAAQIVRAEHEMGVANPVVGHTRIDGLSYLVREREPVGFSLTEKELGTVQDFEILAAHAGRVLARVHARSAAQARALLSWAGDAKVFAANLSRFAQAYAAQSEMDCSAFKAKHLLANTRARVPDYDDTDD